jgi:hypothetical protein
MLLAILFFVSNMTILNMYLPHSYPYRFCADKCQFEVYELGKGHDPIGRVQTCFEDYKADHHRNYAVLHRRFSRNWWQVWNWVEFMFHPRWKYPYAERDEDT